MGTNLQDEENERAAVVPLGSAMVRSGEDSFVIHHTRGGRGFMNVFLIQAY